MANSVKLQGVRVAAYPYLLELNPDGSPKAGPEEAFALTNADGVFQLPTLKGGVYVVTITPQPPNDAVWIGGWTVATAYAHSNDNGWWIYLPRK